MSFLAIFLTAFLASDPTSGPQVGDELKDFKIQGVFGPQANKEFQLAKDVEKKPTLLIFVQKMTRPALRLMRPVDDFAGNEEKLAKHVIFVTDDTNKTTEFLKRAEKSLNLKTPLGICLEGKDGPPSYGLNDQVAMTILVAKDGKVVANFALVDPNETDARKVNQAIAKALGKEAPNGHSNSKKEIRPLIRQLVKTDLPKADTDKILAELRSAVGDNAELRQQLRGLIDRMAEKNLGTAEVRDSLKKIAGE